MNIITYEKFYTDDVGKHIENIFNSNITIKCLWADAIDAFYQYNFPCKAICIYGDIRIVLAKDDGNNTFKFNQYFLSGIDGKVMNIPDNTWFGINNLNPTKAIVLFDYDSGNDEDEKRLSQKIFNWHLKK